MSRRRPSARRRGGLVARLFAGDRLWLLVLVVVFAALAAMSVGPLQTYTAAADRVDSLATTRDRLAVEVGKLEERRNRLHDPDELEIIARQEHGLIKPGEVPFVVITPEPDLDRVGPDAGDEPEPDDAWYRRLGRWLADLLSG
jgi:cell division protein FtsB